MRLTTTALRELNGRLARGDGAVARGSCRVVGDGGHPMTTDAPLPAPLHRPARRRVAARRRSADPAPGPSAATADGGGAAATEEHRRHRQGLVGGDGHRARLGDRGGAVPLGPARHRPGRCVHPPLDRPGPGRLAHGRGAGRDPRRHRLVADGPGGRAHDRPHRLPALASPVHLPPGVRPPRPGRAGAVQRPGATTALRRHDHRQVGGLRDAGGGGGGRGVRRRRGLLLAGRSRPATDDRQGRGDRASPSSSPPRSCTWAWSIRST